MSARSRSIIPSGLAAAFAATLVVACVDPDEAGDAEDDLGTDEEALVGGIATSLRPEVGQFFNGAGSVCTATLIAPRVVLTAAHCLSPAYTATTLASGAVFQFTDAGGTVRAYGADRVHSFGTRRWEYTMFPQTTDVAIVHLTVPVPAGQAMPAQIATRGPYWYELSTIFGYGCTERPGRTGGGAKQAFAFTAGSPSRALCWGDSGGPVFYGSAGAGGAIWGVNSDFYMAGDVTSWTDMFGDVVYYRKQIEGVVRAWDGSDEVGWDRPGMDYAQVSASTTSQCRAACNGDARCAAFTFIPFWSTCMLKDGVPQPVGAWNEQIVSGVRQATEVWIDRAGSDYHAFYLPEPRADLCRAACGRDPQCRAWTYSFPSGWPASACWLKNGVPAATLNFNTTSGVIPNRGGEPGYNRAGHDYATTWAYSARECADTCARDERCTAYTYVAGGAPSCWLKDGVPGGSRLAGASSGVKGGLEVDVDRPGGDYRAIEMWDPLPSRCQATCAAEAQCQAWTYVPPGVLHTLFAYCSLKSSIPPARTTTGMISGLKGHELTP